MDSLKLLKDLRGRLNRFFMHFVSEQVITERHSPDVGIIQWLMDCVTFKEQTSRDFSVFHTEEVIDPTPVLRSFLLKLFIQYPTLDEHLDRLVQSWEEESGRFKVQKMAMLVDCYQVNGDYKYIHV